MTVYTSGDFAYATVRPRKDELPPDAQWMFKVRVSAAQAKARLNRMADDGFLILAGEELVQWTTGATGK